MRGALTPAVELGLRVAAVLSFAVAILWIVGLNGLGLVYLADVPAAAEEVVLGSRTLMDWSQPPSSGALFTDREDVEALFAAHQSIGSTASAASVGYADVTLSTGIQLTDPSLAQSASWAALNAATFLGIAWMWWTLGSLVRSGRGDSPFTRGNARRLARIGGLLLVGGLAASVTRWALLSWMIESSAFADRVVTPSYGITDMPWGTLAVGAAVLVLSQVWQRGLVMADELEGLV